jgi:hypothetical protein
MHIQTSSELVQQESIAIVLEDIKSKRNRSFKVEVFNSSVDVVEIVTVEYKHLYSLSERK